MTHASDPQLGPPIATGLSSHLRPAPTLADHCSTAVRLLDQYDAARTVVLACANERACAPEALREIRGLHGRIAAALDAVADALPEGEPGYSVWVARSAASEVGIIDDAWTRELARLGPRDTEPGEGEERPDPRGEFRELGDG